MPQLSNADRERLALGTCVFDRVPFGFYNVTAEITDTQGNIHMWFAIVNATFPGTHTSNVAIPDYVSPESLQRVPAA